MKGSDLDLNYCTGLEGLRKTAKKLRMVGAPFEIRERYLPNKGQKRDRMSKYDRYRN
jgi:hypothetical protein